MKRDKAKHTSNPDTGKYSKHAILLGIILLLTFIVYLPSLKNDFTNWDDPNYVYKNPTIQKLNKENLKEMLSAYHMGNYHPLTILSLATDYSFGKLKPKTYHITNLVFHLCNTALVFIFILLLFEKIELAAITSVLFGVHTVHVESVAWISERKDVLYTFFFLASLIFYLFYLKEGKNKFYLFSLLLFILSDLSKGMAVSLSLTLFAIDWVKGSDFKKRKVILEKIPFLVISVFFGVIAIFAQKLGNDTEGIPDYNIFTRLIFASYGFCQYLYKLIIPIKLSAFYPYPEKGTLTSGFWISLLIALSVAFAAFYSAKKSKEYLFCFLFFVFNIILVLQILPVGKAIMADRYAYIPSIGFFLAFGIAVSNIKLEKAFIYIPLLVYVLFIGTLTFNRCKVWHDSFSLWTDVIEKYPEAGIAYNNRGVAFAEEKEYKQALADYNQAISIDSSHTEAYNNRGVSRAALKNFAGAKHDYDKAIKLRPNYPDAYYNRGNSFIETEDTISAIKDYTKVLSLNPNHTGALNNRGLAKRAVKDYKGAMEDFNKAIKIYPANSEAYANRALLKYDMGDIAGAEEDNEKALKLDPSLDNAYLQRGNSKSLRKDFVGALADYDRALQKDPNNSEALFKRGVTKINLNNAAGAIEDLNRVIALQPKNPEAYHQRGIAKNNSKDYKGAIEDYNKLLQLKPGYAEGLCNRGIARHDLHDIAGALSDYNKAIEINPNFFEAYSNRGLLKSEQKDNKGAMEDYNKAISINPNFALAYSNRGVLKFNTGDKKGACADWEKAKDLGDMNAKGFYERFCKD